MCLQAAQPEAPWLAKVLASSRLFLDLSSYSGPLTLNLLWRSSKTKKIAFTWRE